MHNKFAQKRQWITLIFFITLLFVIIYHDYILGDKLFMFSDIGSDTIAIIHPFATVAANSHLGSLNDYSFQFGFGGGLYTLLTSYINPSQILTYILPASFLPYTYILCMYISTLLAGIYGYKICHIFSGKTLLCTAIALLFAYSGFISLWGQQPLFGSAYSLIIVYTYYLLTCDFTCFKSELKLIVSLCIISCTGYYFLYMVGLCSTIYLIVKGLISHESCRVILKRLLHLIRAGMFTILLCAFTLLPNLYNFMCSSRSTNITSNVAMSIFYDAKYLITDIARVLSSNLLRVGTDYTGAYNYYEGTILWCSILSIMMLVFHLIYKSNYKHRIVFGICAASLLFPAITKLMTFDATKQRWTFIYIIVLLCLCIYSLDYLIKNAQQLPIKQWLLLSDLIIGFMLAFVCLCRISGQIQISKRSLLKIVFVLLLYNIVFLALKRLKQYIVILSLLLVVCLDVCLETYPTANNRVSITKDEYTASMYNDGTSTAADYIQSNDTGLYRISKSYNSVFLNDAMMQGYNGTTTYNAVPSSSVSEYMLYNEIPFARDADYSKASKYVSVPFDNYYINTLLGVKYQFTKDPASISSNYTLLTQIGDVYIYQNDHPLSFGYLYHHAISRDGFSELSTDQKAYAMTNGFYLTNELKQSNILSQYAMIDIASLNDTQALNNIQQLQTESLYDMSYVDHELIGQINNTDVSDAMLCFPVFFDHRWTAYVDGKKVSTININGGLIGVSIPKGEHQVKLIYSDPTVYFGIFVSLTTLMLLVIYFVLLRKGILHFPDTKNNLKMGKQKFLLFSGLLIVICCSIIVYGKYAGSTKDSDQKYLDQGGTLITQYGNDSTSASQYSFWTVETSDSFTIIDGGTTQQADTVRTVIKEHNNHVNNWILTHPHPDHMGVFNQLMSENYHDIKIDHLYTVQIPLEDYELIARDVDDINTYYTFLDLTNMLNKTTKLSVEYLHPGDTLSLGSSQLKVYNEYSEKIKEQGLDLPNSSSLVFRIAGNEHSMLFFADFEDAGLADELYAKYGHELDSTYIQLGHHGNNALNPSFYLNLHPSAVYADAPYFLYSGDQYNCKKTLAYLSQHDIKCFTFQGAPHRIYLQ